MKLLPGGPPRQRRARVDTCLMPGPGSREAGLVEGGAVLAIAFAFVIEFASIDLGNELAVIDDPV